MSDSTEEALDLIFTFAEPLVDESILALGKLLSVIVEDFEAFG